MIIQLYFIIFSKSYNLPETIGPYLTGVMEFKDEKEGLDCTIYYPTSLKPTKTEEEKT